MTLTEAWTWLDWLWVVGGSLGGLTGLVLAWWSLRRGKTCKDPVCPVCRYDMRGLAGLQCPECGRTAPNSADFVRRPRRWRLGLMGAGIALAGAGAGVHPQVRRNGWVSILPTTVVMLVLPAEDTHGYYDETTMEWIENPAVREFRRRLGRGSVSDWQVRWAVERHRGMVLHRAKWPVDRALVLGVKRPVWVDLGETQLLARLPDAQPIGAGVRHYWACGNAAMGQHALERGQLAGTLPPGTKAVTLDYTFAYAVYDPDAAYAAVVCFRTVAGTMEVPIEAVAAHDEACAPCPAEPFGAALRAAAGLQLLEKNDPADPDEPERWQDFFVDTDVLKSLLADTTASLRLDLLRDGVPVDDPNYIMALGDPRSGYLDGLSRAAGFEPLKRDWSKEPSAEIARWSLRITGRHSDPYSMPRVEQGKDKDCQWQLTRAVEMQMFGDVLLEFDKPGYWSGSIEVPLVELILHGRAVLKARLEKTKQEEAARE